MSVDGKSAAQKLSTSQTDTTDTYEDCLDVPDDSNLDKSVSEEIISQQTSHEIFFDRLVENGIITRDGKPVDQEPGNPAIAPKSSILSQLDLSSLKLEVPHPILLKIYNAQK